MRRLVKPVWVVSCCSRLGKEDMSKIGKRPVAIPAGTTVTIADGIVTAKGPKGELSVKIEPGIAAEIRENEVFVTMLKDVRSYRAAFGLVRSLINNAVTGVSTGFTRRLQLVGTGYRVAKKGSGLNLTVGYSHPVVVEPTPGVTLDVDGNTIIIISGADKHTVGQLAANIRKIRPPEPYKGKGIRYEDEIVRRKQGKAVAK
jgi:large subunit ribosomal protein L6